MGSRRSWEAAVVALSAILLTVCLTYPLAFNLARVGRVDNGDGKFSIWNVAWVAHSLLADPDHVADANIFSPHRGALFFSEANIGAGALAVPVYWLTDGNPYAAHNSVVLAAFVFSLLAAYGLARYLTASTAAAALTAVTFAFCPYVFARTAHIQLLMVAGLPLVLLAFHVFVDRLSVASAVGLALALVATGLCCGYYGVFAGFIVGFGVVYAAVAGRLWRKPRYWLLVGLSAALALSLMFPLLRPYLAMGGTRPFRSLEQAADWSADWRAYLAAAGWGNGWIREVLAFRPPYEVLFPGFVTLVLAAAGAVSVLAARNHGSSLPPGQSSHAPAGPFSTPASIVLFYVLLAALAFWLSFGPRAGLYYLFYRFVPVFTLLRAPARFGLVVTLALAVLAGFGLKTILGLARRRVVVAVAITAAAVLELAPVPLSFRQAPEVAAAYRTLAHLPRGPVAEFPFFWRRIDFHRHTEYMLNSTFHWKPLVNGYSDRIPLDFYEVVAPLSTFPSPEGFAALRERHALYVVFHLNFYNQPNKERLFQGLDRYQDYLRPLIRQGNTWLYEIVAFPR